MNLSFQIEETLDVLEKMDVTVLGTTGCGNPELANIHRDNSRIRLEISIIDILSINITLVTEYIHNKTSHS